MGRGGEKVDVESAVGPVEASVTVEEKPAVSIPRRPNAISRLLFLFIDPIIRQVHAGITTLAALL